MKVYRSLAEFDKGQGSVVTVGSFDGVHRGHRLLIDALRAEAAVRGLRGVVVTFEPHPRLVLRGDNLLLTPFERKLELMEQAGVDHLMVLNFTKEFAQIPYDIFVRDYLVGGLGARVVVVGQGHHFGKGKQGDAEALKAMELEVVYLERFENISSTQVRNAIRVGDYDRASELLGWRYTDNINSKK
ncbi:MAG: FAD synthase [Mucinivorans sp.]